MKNQNTLKQIGKELEVDTRHSTPVDWKEWAHSPLVATHHYSSDYKMELNENNKVYILYRDTVTRATVIGVVDKPTPKLIALMKGEKTQDESEANK